MAVPNGPTACRPAGLNTGGLGMMAIGFCYLALVRQGASPNISGHGRIAPTLCAYGLIATLVSCVLGYVICDYFWPNFYFHPVHAGKNVWLAAQGLGVLSWRCERAGELQSDTSWTGAHRLLP
jgi:hypothetical protein